MSKFFSYGLLITSIVLSGLGLIMLASTSYQLEGGAFSHDMLFRQIVESILGRQIVIFLLGLTALFVIWRIDPVWWIRYWVWIYVFGVILLALCYVPHVGVDVNGAKRWVQFPGLPRFQPSEIGKLTTIIGVAGYFSRRIGEIRTFLKGFVYPSALISLPIALVFFEKDMDTALCMGVVFALVLFCIGVQKRYLIPSFIAVCVFGYGMVMSDPVRRKRIDAFINFDRNLPEYEDVNRQQKNSLLGFELGGYEGKSITMGRQKLGFLPEAHTDFIFSVIGEELGVRVTTGVVVMYVFFTICGLMIASNSRIIIGRIIAIGCTTSIVMPALMNIAVVTALLPNAGLPLPFLSYGGTNLLCTLVNVGVLLSISRVIQPIAKPKLKFTSSSIGMRV